MMMNGKPWFVYVLLCQDGSLYTGSSDNIDKRFQTHVSGKGSKYTRSHKPVSVIYSEQLSDKSAALKREHEIKSWSRKMKIERLELKLSQLN